MSSGSKTLVALSISTLLAACGGGGSEPSSTAPTGQPLLVQTPSLGSTAAAQISEANFRDLVDLATSADAVPFGTADAASYNVVAALKSSTDVAPAIDFVSRAVTSTAVNCRSGSGTVQVTDADGNPATTAPGDGRTGTYDNCFVDGFFPMHIDGTFTNTIDTITGSLPELLLEPELGATTPAFSFTATRTADIEIQLLFDGGFVLTDSATTKVSSSFDGNTLTHSIQSTGDFSFGDSEAIVVVRDQTANASVTRLAPSSFDVTVSYSVTLLSNLVNGSVVVTTLTPMHAVNGVIESGSVKVTGAGNSSLTVTVTAANTAQVTVDFDGDGVVDRTETVILDP